MDHDLKFELLTDDVMKMQPVIFGSHYRALVVFSSGLVLALCLYNIFVGEHVILSLLGAIPAVVTLFDRWLLYPPYLATRRTDARVKIDDKNLTSSLGKKSYSIPWQYFVRFGSVTETDDHFYFKCKLGKIYVPKRAFSSSDAIDQFRTDVSVAIGSNFQQLSNGQEVLGAR